MANFDFTFDSIANEVLDDSLLAKDQALSEKLSSLFNQRYLLAYTREIDDKKTVVIQFNTSSSSITMQAVVMFFAMHGLNDWLIVRNYIVIDANMYGWARIEVLIKNL